MRARIMNTGSSQGLKTSELRITQQLDRDRKDHWLCPGFVPDTEYRALLDRYIDGSISLDEVRADTDRKIAAILLQEKAADS